MFPFLNGHLLVGSLKFKQLYLVVLENGLPARESVMMDGAIGRVRDVAIAYDGSVLLLSDEEEGGLTASLRLAISAAYYRLLNICFHSIFFA